MGGNRMSSHRIPTNRKKTVVIAGCPNGCQQWEIESEGDGDAVDKLVEKVNGAFGACRNCGEPMGHIRRDEQTEMLE